MVESLDFIADQLTSGLQRSAVRTTGHDRMAGMVEYELRLSREDREQTLRLTIDVITGKRPADVFRIAFRDSFQTTSTIPDIYARRSCSPSPAIIPSEFATDNELAKEIAACEALVEIQKVTRARIVAPNLNQVTWNQFLSWNMAAALIRGEVITGRWDQGARIHLRPGDKPPTGAGAIPSHNPWTIEIGDSPFTIGTVEMRLEAARLDETHPPEQHDGHWDIWVLPAGTNTWTLRMISKGPG